MTDYAPHFSKHELTFSQTATRYRINNTLPLGLEGNLIRLSWWLETLRKHVGRPIFVTSGYRSPELNTMINGSTTSAHMRGLAADIVVFNMPSYELANMAAQQMEKHKFDQIINEFGRWVHVGLAPLGEARGELLTATKQDGMTRYYKGIIDAD